MLVCVQQCPAVEGDREDFCKFGVVAELTEEGSASFSAVVHSVAYVVYKRRPRGLRDPLGSSQDSFFDGRRVKRR